jgi:hypothetical protein
MTCIDHQLNAQIYLFYNNIYYIVNLNMFRASLCSSSGGKIVRIFTVSGIVTLCVLTYSPQSVTIPETENIQLDLLKISTAMLETC